MLIFSNVSADYIEKARRVLQYLSGAGVTLMLKSFKFFAEKINYIDHATRPYHLKLAELTPNAVAKLDHI